ncbi:50S ribosomal protein L25 [Candidatus Microgenomates bacterium]|nr:50S ribosomal protein L25 [Candidatus Microgenomates bacterium]
MSNIKLKSEKRTVFGRKVKKLREAGKVPANIFGKKVKSNAITVDLKEFKKVYSEAGETQIIDLSGKPVLVSNMTKDPVSEDILHIDFRQVDLTEKISAAVPIVIEGESPAEKQGLGTVVSQIDEVEVEALPTDLPEKIVVDVSILLEVDQAIYIKDLKVSSKVEIKEDADAIIVKVEPLQKEEEVVVAVPAEGVEGAEAIEGEAPAEGEKPEDKEEAKIEDKKE